MVKIRLKEGQNGYDEVYKYVERYWEHNGYGSAIVALILGGLGDELSYHNEIVSPQDGGAEWLYDWWEGEKFIDIIGIKNIDEFDIFGGIYEE